MVRAAHATCSALCRAVVHEMDRAQRICEATRDPGHWVAAVALNDAVTDYFSSDHRVYRSVRELGVSNDDWRLICNGG